MRPLLLPAFLLLPGLLLLSTGARAGDDLPTAAPAPTPEPARERPPLPSTSEERRARALALLAGPGGAEAVAAEAATGPAARRRAALEALATLTPATFPPSGVLPAVEALGSADPLLRRAAVGAMLAAGPPAEALLGKAAEGAEGAPALERERALDGLFDLRRAAVEEAFLAAWTPADGSYRGMYAGIAPRGGAAARVLTAIALDRRTAGRTMLGYGPYAWLRPPGPERERPEIRYRALDALVDVGDGEAREALRGALRARPADRLFDDLDDDPVPATTDDALRDVIAALGDVGPLLEMIAASDAAGGFGPWSNTIEMRRRARAFSTLAECASTEKVRAAHYTTAEELHRESTRQRKRIGMPVDGVDWYNLACVLARRDRPGDRAEAISLIRDSLETYSVTADWLSRDGDLANLRGEKGFVDLLAWLRARERELERGR